MRSPNFFRAASIAAQLLVATAAVSLAAAPSAHAHAVIIASSPKVDQTVPPGPLDIELHYNSRIDHRRSRVTLIGADGVAHQIAIAPGGAPDVISGRVSDIAPGQYRIRWQVLAVDGHLTRGDIPFSVKAP